MLNVLTKIGSHGAICSCCICKQPYTTNDKYYSAKALAGDQCTACKTLPTNLPTKELLLQVFDYDPATGKLVYKRDFDRRRKGDDPTSVMNNGYLLLTLDKSYLAHRMIWLMQTGDLPVFVDHINHVRTDNSWDNLRDSSRQGNAQNKSINTNNTSGYLGVSYMPTKRKFRATLTCNRKQVHLGLFETAELANAARVFANKKYNFHENHGEV